MGRRLHERARIFQRPVTGVREGCEGAGRKGLCILSAEGRKREFLSDAKYLAHKRVSWLRTRHHAESCSCTCRSVRTRSLAIQRMRQISPLRMVMDSFSITRTSVHSPWVRHAWGWRKSLQHSIKTIHIISREQAQNTPAPVTTYAPLRTESSQTQGASSPTKKFLKLAGVQV